ncbi:unnamed protein product [Blepharisma stoltei]|uniref:Maturase K n=1 Tax=Blepharisma stoltei TaxID=1481888 RepID=A0AAU9JMW8_9CILI|nr:unnamed protein product [Blepharisma stoltei]
MYFILWKEIFALYCWYYFIFSKFKVMMRSRGVNYRVRYILIESLILQSKYSLFIRYLRKTLAHPHCEIFSLYFD